MATRKHYFSIYCTCLLDLQHYPVPCTAGPVGCVAYLLNMTAGRKLQIKFKTKISYLRNLVTSLFKKKHFIATTFGESWYRMRDNDHLLDHLEQQNLVTYFQWTWDSFEMSPFLLYISTFIIKCENGLSTFAENLTGSFRNVAKRPHVC